MQALILAFHCVNCKANAHNHKDIVMVDTIKFSEFLDGGDITQGDTTVGLAGGVNSKFSNPWTFLPSGTTGDRPTVAAAMYFRQRLNTQLQVYEYYDPINVQWTELSGSGSGTVSTGAINNIPYYAAAGNTLSPMSSLSNAVLITSGAGVPSLSTTLPTGLSVPGAAITTSTAALVSGSVNATPVSTTDITNKLYVDSTVAGSITSIIGTANQVLANGTVATPQTGAVTLTLPQSIASTSTPTFAGLVLSSPLSPLYGGNGIANASGSTLTLGGATEFSGAFASVLNVTGSTNITLPTSGTLATVGATVASISGTLNQVLVNGTFATPTTGATTLTLPQDIATTSSPTFLAINLTTDLTVANGGTGRGTATPYGLIFGGTSSTSPLQSIASLGSSGTLLQSAGVAALPVFTTATYPTTSTINQILYSPSNNVITGLASGASSVLVTDGSSVPSFSGTLPATVQSNITQLGTQSTALNMGMNLVGSVTDPVSAQDAATKHYVDSIVAGFTPQQAVQAASTTNLTASYFNGVSGVGATLTNSGALAAFTLDGQTGVLNDPYLIKNQSSSIENGVYILSVVGSGATAWVLTRASYYDSPSDINQSGVIPVISGTVNAGTGWLETATVTTIGVDPIVFIQFGQTAGILPVASGGTGIGSTTINQLLWSPSANVIGGLATQASSALLTDGSGVPSWVSNTGTGSPVLATSPTLITPILGTPTSGNLVNAVGLPVATGISGLGANVATYLATPSSLNLYNAMTTKTGTGNLVFATSPALVTPDLGVPSAATLTNATGLPIGSGVSGLGAGIATFLATPSSANLAAAVTDETGSGSLVFSTSPTLVTPALGTPSALVLTNATGLLVPGGLSATGTPSNVTYLRGDGAWAIPAGSSTGGSFTDSILLMGG
jgi:hypothetical protein